MAFRIDLTSAGVADGSLRDQRGVAAVPYEDNVSQVMRASQGLFSGGGIAASFSTISSCPTSSPFMRFSMIPAISGVTSDFDPRRVAESEAEREFLMGTDYERARTAARKLFENGSDRVYSQIFTAMVDMVYRADLELAENIIERELDELFSRLYLPGNPETASQEAVQKKCKEMMSLVKTQKTKSSAISILRDAAARNIVELFPVIVYCRAFLDMKLGAYQEAEKKILPILRPGQSVLPICSNMDRFRLKALLVLVYAGDAGAQSGDTDTLSLKVAALDTLVRMQESIKEAKCQMITGLPS